MNVLSCVYNETGNSINKLNRGQLHVLWPAARMFNKVSDDACQWNAREYEYPMYEM